MSTHSVRFDAKTDGALKHLVNITGLTLSQVMREALLRYNSEISQAKNQNPFMIYRKIDIGVGGHSLGPSSRTKETLRRTLKIR